MGDAKDLWVAAFLNIDLTQPDERREQISERLKIGITSVKLLGQSPAVAQLSDQIREIAGLLKSGSLDQALLLLDALEDAIAEATKASRRQEAVETSGHRVDYMKLMLRWRGAQTAANAEIERFCQTILNDGDVMQDPRYDEVVAGIDGLRDVVPDFGSRLEDVLEALDKLDPADDGEALVESALDLIADYRAVLSDSDDLAELSLVAQQEFGVTLAIDGELRQVLGEIADRLAA